MKRYILLLGLCGLITGNLPAQKISLESIWLRFEYYPSSPSEFRWMNDDQYYSVLEAGKGIARFSIEEEKKVDEVLDFAALELGELTAKEIKSYEFNENESLVLLKAQQESIYRRSSKEVCLVADRNSGKTQLIAEGKKISNASFSPDGSKLAYCYENNLYYQDLNTGKQTQLTKDGKWNHIINGSTDWVYEEELSLVKAYEFSPNGQYLAYFRFDESEVKEFTLPFYGPLYPELYQYKYPKAGEDNALVTIHVVDLETGKTVEADLGQETDQYIARMHWANEEQLALMRLNRLQNQCDLILTEAKTGQSQTLLNERADAYIEVSDDKWHFLENSSDFLWMSEVDGYNHLYRYDQSGELVAQLTSGNFEVTELVGIDEANEKVYFLSAEVSPLERQLYVVDLKGKKKKQLTEKSGTHSVAASSKFNYFVDSYSSPTEPGLTRLIDAKGKTLKVLEDNARLKQKLGRLDISPPEFFQFTTSEGAELNGWMIKPADFDPNREYPVFMYVYGGPGSQTVQKNWGSFNYMWFQMLAQQGYIVVSVDNQGTGARGRDFRTATYPELGKQETIDQIEAAKYLQGLPYVDEERIGIWGWSYGGYMTALCMTKGGGIFKMGIAVAPVSTWRYYDTIYTERYLKTPQLNPKGYDENSPLNFAGDLEGKLLLVHGTGDDNVHYQNSMDLVTALVNANKQFDAFFYPNKNHGIFGGYTRFHLYKKMTDYILENL
jgi:dipeptidyl-peptidase-4